MEENKYSLNKRKQHGFVSLVCMLLSISLLAGCSFFEKGALAVGGSEMEPETLGMTPDFNYVVPENSPNILVSQAGYKPNSKKIVIFKGESITGDFDVIDEKTGVVVYTGKIEDEGYNETMKEYNSYGVFDELQTEGSYYIQTQKLGQSYPFPIGSDIYDGIFDEACKQYYLNRCGITLLEEFAGTRAHNACHTKQGELQDGVGVMMDVSGGWHMDGDHTKSVEKGSVVMANLLLALELYPSAFSDDSGIPESGNGIPDILDEIKYEADWMLKMQDRTTGGVHSQAIVSAKSVGGGRQETYVEPVSLEATAVFSAVMAKFSYLYQPYDADYATACIRAADRAWKYLEKNKKGQVVENSYFAAAELFRATGYQTYKKEVERYLEEKIYLRMGELAILWGSVTYLSTRQNVEKTLCTIIMKEVMANAEEIAAATKQSQYLTIGNKEQDNNSQLLHEISQLAVADHIISNHEYETVIENQLHYFSGRNPKSISYLDNVGENSYKKYDVNLGLMNRFDSNAELIFMMSEIMAVTE